MYSKQNEMAAWKHIKKLAEEALKRYPTTLDEDLEILARDSNERTLSNNIRNCIIYRKSEKAILHFLKECAAKAENLMKITS